jgi:hypothetical protein
MSDQAQDQNNRPSPTPAADHLDDTSTVGQEAIDMEPNVLATSNASGFTTRHHQAPPPPLLSESALRPGPRAGLLELKMHSVRVDFVTEQQNLDLQRQLAHCLTAIESRPAIEG